MFNDLEENRKIIRQAWQKRCDNLPQTPLESQIVTIIEQHPEYHDFFSGKAADTQANEPFLHIGLHMAILEQLSLDRPSGIVAIYQKLLTTGLDAHQVDHQLMQGLQSYIRQLFETNSPPNDQDYLAHLTRLVATP